MLVNFDALLEVKNLEILTKSFHIQIYEEVESSNTTIEISLPTPTQEGLDVENLNVTVS